MFGLGVSGIIIVTIIIIGLYIVTQLRKVVPTNEVHIVQRGRKSVPHGKGLSGGNVYLAWASWVPVFGIFVQKLPLSIFDLQLNGYKAYDIGKVPFQVDVTAFFEIKDPVLAAEKIFTITELKNQLNETVKGVVRKILASKDVVDIMESRGDIKDEFYKEVFTAVKSWGVDLKNVEFMDIRDEDDSKVITNIMMKKRSLIESESQIEVAENEKRAIIEKENKSAEARAKSAEANSKADIAASDAKRSADLKKIENEQLTKNKDIEKERVLSIQEEEAKQNFYDAEKETKIKLLAVKQVEEEKNAEIAKNIEVIRADEQRQKLVIEAEADKRRIELESEADKTKVEMAASAEKIKIESVGLAKAKELDYIGTAEAKNKAQMADSLNMFTDESIAFMVKQLEVQLSEVVDLEKAKALGKADVKVISTGKNGGEGISSFMDLFSANGGTNIGAMVEAAKNTIGEEKVNSILGKIKSSISPKQNEKTNTKILKKTVKKTKVEDLPKEV